MSKVLIVGDRILDHYIWGRADHLCREAPVPVMKLDRETNTDGGAALVAAQLKELIGAENVYELYGSLSYKHRVFGDDHLICRWDEDSIDERADLRAKIDMALRFVEAIIVSDYGKSGMTRELADLVMASGKPVFVDAKHTWDWYKGAFCAFPNKTEQLKGFSQDGRDGLVLSTRDWPFEHVVRKVGAGGCLLDDAPIPPSSIDYVRDCTGAGDIFLASFVADYLEYKNLIHAAQFANLVAGISVKHVGTYVVPKKEIIPLDNGLTMFAEATD